MGSFTAQVLPRFMQIIMGESETTFGSKLLEELDDGADVACWGLHVICLYLSRMKNDHDQGFSQVHLEKAT